MLDPLLDVLLESWDRNNTILLNLLGALPEGGLAAKATATSPSVSQMFSHLCHERMVSVSEEAPEFATEAPPQEEWREELDRGRLAELLIGSAAMVRNAVQGRIEAGRDLSLHFDHPALLLQLLIFHEGYHHGQIKLALKAAGLPLSDGEAGPLTWDIWRRRGVVTLNE